MQQLALAPTTCQARASLLDRVAKALHAHWLEHRRRRRLKMTVRTLQGLSDHTLKDIGLDRSEIESVIASRGVDRLRPRVELDDRSRL